MAGSTTGAGFSVELYSPNGQCQYNLASLPMGLTSHSLFRYEDSLLACAGFKLMDFKTFGREGDRRDHWNKLGLIGVILRFEI